MRSAALLIVFAFSILFADARAQTIERVTQRVESIRSESSAPFVLAKSLVEPDAGSPYWVVQSEGVWVLMQLDSDGQVVNLAQESGPGTRGSKAWLQQDAQGRIFLLSSDCVLWSYQSDLTGRFERSVDPLVSAPKTHNFRRADRATHQTKQNAGGFGCNGLFVAIDGRVLVQSQGPTGGKIFVFDAQGQRLQTLAGAFDSLSALSLHATPQALVLQRADNRLSAMDSEGRALWQYQPAGSWRVSFIVKAERDRILLRAQNTGTTGPAWAYHLLDGAGSLLAAHETSEDGQVLDVQFSANGYWIDFEGQETKLYRAQGNAPWHLVASRVPATSAMLSLANEELLLLTSRWTAANQGSQLRQVFRADGQTRFEQSVPAATRLWALARLSENNLIALGDQFTNLAFFEGYARTQALSITQSGSTFELSSAEPVIVEKPQAVSNFELFPHQSGAALAVQGQPWRVIKLNSRGKRSFGVNCPEYPKVAIALEAVYVACGNLLRSYTQTGELRWETALANAMSISAAADSSDSVWLLARIGDTGFRVSKISATLRTDGGVFDAGTSLQPSKINADGSYSASNFSRFLRIDASGAVLSEASNVRELYHDPAGSLTLGFVAGNRFTYAWQRDAAPWQHSYNRPESFDFNPLGARFGNTLHAIAPNAQLAGGAGSWRWSEFALADGAATERSIPFQGFAKPSDLLPVEDRLYLALDGSVVLEISSTDVNRHTQWNSDNFGELDQLGPTLWRSDADVFLVAFGTPQGQAQQIVVQKLSSEFSDGFE